jgi:hypothetical protein
VRRQGIENRNTFYFFGNFVQGQKMAHGNPVPGLPRAVKAPRVSRRRQYMQRPIQGPSPAPGYTLG